MLMNTHEIISNPLDKNAEIQTLLHKIDGFASRWPEVDEHIENVHKFYDGELSYCDYYVAVRELVKRGIISFKDYMDTLPITLSWAFDPIICKKNYLKFPICDLSDNPEMYKLKLYFKEFIDMLDQKDFFDVEAFFYFVEKIDRLWLLEDNPIFPESDLELYLMDMWLRGKDIMQNVDLILDRIEESMGKKS